MDQIPAQGKSPQVSSGRGWSGITKRCLFVEPGTKVEAEPPVSLALNTSQDPTQKLVIPWRGWSF